MGCKVAKKIYILVNHSINYKIENGKLYAEEVYCSRGVAYSTFIDITNFSISQLYDWLGY